jgi:HlyD family secretion protein
VIHNIGDQIFTNPLSTNPKLVFILANVQLQTELESSRPNIEQMLNSWSLSLNGILSSADNLSSYLNTATANLNSIKSFLDEAADAVNTLSPNVQLTLATIQGWRTNISLARTNINGGSSALSAATQNLVVSQDGLRIAQDQLIQTQAGATDEQIKSQQQQVNSMQAALESINIQISKTMVRSPLDGIITRCDATTGEVVSPNVPQITVISGGQFQIDVYVSEADIAKIKVGNPANVTLDTYGNGIIFEAKVISIDPAATLINGANDYKITLAFNDQDSRIKAGMTANADILTASVKQVLAAPKQAVITEGSDKYIMVEVGNSQPQKHKIEVGITGANGYVQIISGVSEGDRIISFISAK